ncbi:hypothetical protein DF186_24420, partial [Enterococcus hirae]
TYRFLCMCFGFVCSENPISDIETNMALKSIDFSTIDMIIETKQMFFGKASKVRPLKSQPYSGKGGGEHRLICI